MENQQQLLLSCNIIKNGVTYRNWYFCNDVSFTATVGSDGKYHRASVDLTDKAKAKWLVYEHNNKY